LRVCSLIMDRVLRSTTVSCSCSNTQEWIFDGALLARAKAVRSQTANGSRCAETGKEAIAEAARAAALSLSGCCLSEHQGAVRWRAEVKVHALELGTIVTGPVFTVVT